MTHAGRNYVHWNVQNFTSLALTYCLRLPGGRGSKEFLFVCVVWQTIDKCSERGLKVNRNVIHTVHVREARERRHSLFGM